MCSNLVAACVLLVWFQRVGTLPASTSHVLTQVGCALSLSHSLFCSPALLPTLPLSLRSCFCSASLGHLAHQSSSSSSSFLLRPLQLSPRPSTALHQLAAAIAASLDQTTTEPTIEAAAKPAAEPTQQVGNQQLGEALMTLLLLVVMTAVCETGGGGDGLAGQLALLAVGGCGPALLILACDALLWSQRQPDGADSPLAVTSTSGPLLLNRFFTPPVFGVLAGLLIGATPLSQLFLLPRGGDGLVETSTLLIDSGSLLGWLQWQAGEMTGSMHCFMEAASFLGSAALPLHLMALVSSLVPRDSLETPHSQHQLHHQQQQAILSPVKTTHPRDAAASSPELPL
ncbi:unnamed protein product [Closterium sp. NIES-54]